MEASMDIEVKIKRAYEPAASDDGDRVLIDRLWPRGVRKEDAQIEAWMKDLAPSTELRKSFGHDPDRWPEFKRRYTEELRAPQARQAIDDVAVRAARGPVTLVYGARDTEHNDAVVLRPIVERRARRLGMAAPSEGTSHARPRRATAARRASGRPGA
jgi:uncharacterized protein YeaO (DUF488 family)